MENICEVGVLTYDAPHRKTFDVLCQLRAAGYHDVKVFAVPFHYKKTFVPLIEHRPPVMVPIQPEDLCRNLSFSFQRGNRYSDFRLRRGATVLVCGAGILPDEFLMSYQVINSHPGYIPDCRGLDSLKWAIYEGGPIGVTTHIITEYVDAGYVVERRQLPLHPYDTFHALAQRVYETECRMLIEAIQKSKEGVNLIKPPAGSVVHRRMPHEYEELLFTKFEQRIRKQEKEG